jgi:hypothetical protein
VVRIAKVGRTKTYIQYLAHWAKKLSWKEVAPSLGASWEKVLASVEYVVKLGLKHRSMKYWVTL